MSYELHTLCTLFPRLAGLEFDALCKDIQANGLREPIVLHENQILDGGNRYQACLAVGVEPTFKTFDGDSIVSFVLSANLHRRHMTPGQQAAIVASAQDWAKAHKHGGDHTSEQGKAVDFATVEQRAAASGASRVTQMKADKVARANPELAQQVGRGEVKLEKAVAQVTGKPSKPPKPAKPDNSLMYQGEDLSSAMDMSIDDILADMDALEKEKAGLEERIKALTADDLGKELDNQVRITQGIEARLGQEMDRANLFNQELRGYGKWFADLRKVLNMPNATRTEITAAVRELVNQQQEAF